MAFSQTRLLEWVVIPFFRGSSWPRDQTYVSWVTCIDRQILYQWATWEAAYVHTCLRMISQHVKGVEGCTWDWGYRWSLNGEVDTPWAGRKLGHAQEGKRGTCEMLIVLLHANYTWEEGNIENTKQRWEWKAVESKGHGSYSAPPLLPEATWPSDTRSPEASRGAGNPDFHVKLKHCSYQHFRKK